MVSRSSINKASVPAKVIANIAFARSPVENDMTERYYILDREYEASSVLSILRDGSSMGKVLVQTMQQMEMASPAKGSSASTVLV